MSAAPIAGRLLVDPPAGGAWNMAVDEWLLATARDEPTLRFYRWSPATLSLGYFQAFAERAEHTASRACDCVRRRSGGGAIVHDQELTYSLTLPASSPWRRRPQEMYQLMHQMLVELLTPELGEGTRLAMWQGEDAAATAATPFLCFERRAIGDIVVWKEGVASKVVGSAQRKLRGAVLQHGSLLWRRSSYAPELAGLEDLGASPIDEPGLITAVSERLAATLNIRWDPRPLSPQEGQAVAQIAADRFAQSAWNHLR